MLWFWNGIASAERRALRNEDWGTGTYLLS